jgi:chemotaxis protein CheD
VTGALPRVVPVGLGGLAAARGEPVVLAAYGLGSCVAVVAWGWAAGARVLGLAHVVLPASLGRPAPEPARYADQAVPALLARLRALGAGPRLWAVLAGGAAMFPGTGRLADVGAANAQAVREALRAAGVPVLAEELGGDRGRTVLAEIPSGRVAVASGGRPVRVLWDGRPEPGERGAGP